MLAASGWPKMPKTPHSSLNLSNMLLRPHACAKYRSIAVDHTRSASSTDRSIDDRAADRDPQPIAAGLADHARRHVRRRRALAAPRVTSSGTTETTTRDADSPKSAAASFDARIARDVDAVDRRPRRRCRPCRSSTRRASPPGRRPSSRARIESAARRRASTSSCCSARSASRSSAGGTPRTRSCTTFRYSLPPSSPRPSPSSTMTSPAPWKRRPTHAVGVLEQADDADHRRRIDRACRRSRCRG